MNELLLKNFQELPESIKTLELLQLEIKEKIDFLEKEMDTQDSQFRFIISGEKTEEGKTKFSNEESRKSAVALLKKSDESFNKIERKHDELKRDLFKNEVQIGYLIRSFSVLKRLTDNRLYILKDE